MRVGLCEVCRERTPEDKWHFVKEDKYGLPHFFCHRCAAEAYKRECGYISEMLREYRKWRM